MKLSESLKCFKNAESPFTEFFSLAQPIRPLSGETLKAMQKHLENGTEILLQGMQSYGQLLEMAKPLDPKLLIRLHGVGFFISCINNLFEALQKVQQALVYQRKITRKNNERL